MCRGKQLCIVYCENYEGTTPSGEILPEKYNSLSAPFTQQHKLPLLPGSYEYYDKKDVLHFPASRPLLLKACAHRISLAL